jgi:hypothetical protein
MTKIGGMLALVLEESRVSVMRCGPRGAMRSPKASLLRHTGFDHTARRATTTCPIVTVISAALGHFVSVALAGCLP